MTLWRWDHDPELHFPPPVKIRKPLSYPPINPWGYGWVHFATAVAS